MADAYSRVGVVRIPVSPTSGSTQFPLPAELIGVANLSFYMENLTPYDIRLEGTTSAQMTNGGFRAVTANTGWPSPARTKRGPWVSKMPVMLSAMIVDTPGNPVDAGGDYSNTFLDLIYVTRV